MLRGARTPHGGTLLALRRSRKRATSHVLKRASEQFHALGGERSRRFFGHVRLGRQGTSASRRACWPREARVRRVRCAPMDWREAISRQGGWQVDQRSPTVVEFGTKQRIPCSGCHPASGRVMLSSSERCARRRPVMGGSNESQSSCSLCVWTRSALWV